MTLRRRLRDIVRHFPENGMKLPLENPYTARELLALERLDLFDRIDWPRVTVDRTTYVQRDYRHVEADVVLHAPLVSSGRGRARRLVIYLLIEHQSEPDAWMLLRMVEYVMQIYKAQWRAAQRRGSRAAVRLNLVLPVVFYTGAAPWPSLGRFADLVELGDRHAGFVPELAPLFINLRDIPTEHLEAEGGAFGWVLRLMRERQARPREFRALLERAVAQLEELQSAEQVRWWELLSYLQALVYNARSGAERTPLTEIIAASAQTAADQQEIVHMWKTYAEELLEKGERKGRKEGALAATQRMLIQQLHERFGDIPPSVEKKIRETRSLPTLERWLRRFAVAQTLDDVGIPTAEDA